MQPIIVTMVSIAVKVSTLQLHKQENCECDQIIVNIKEMIPLLFLLMLLYFVAIHRMTITRCVLTWTDFDPAY